MFVVDSEVMHSVQFILPILIFHSIVSHRFCRGLHKKSHSRPLWREQLTSILSNNRSNKRLQKRIGQNYHFIKETTAERVTTMLS